MREDIRWVECKAGAGGGGGHMMWAGVVGARSHFEGVTGDAERS